MNNKKEKICKITPKEYRIISKLIQKDVESINYKDINKKQLKAWKKYYSPRMVKKFLKEMNCFKLKKNKKTLGVVFFNKGELEALYVKKDHIGKGVGKKLLRFIENFAKKNGFKKIKLISSKYADKFYKRLNYKYIKPAYPSLFGVKFHEKWMEKKLK